LRNVQQAEHVVKRITFSCTEAKSGDTLYVSVPKLNVNEVLVPGSLALIFNSDLSGGHANNFLVQNVTRVLVDRLHMKFGGTTLQDMVGYGIYKIFDDLFLSQEKRDGMILKGIQSEDLCKICSGAGDEKTSGIAAENKLNEVYGSKYRIRLDHQILTDNGVFYPQALYNDLVFKVTLAEAEHVVIGTDTTQLKYKLTNIQLEYEMIHSKTLADEAYSEYSSRKEFAYDHMMRSEVVIFKKDTDTRKNISQRPKKVARSPPATFHRALYRWSQRFGKIHLPGSDESQRHNQRLAQHDL